MARHPATLAARVSIHNTLARVVFLVVTTSGLTACGLVPPGGPAINVSATAELEGTQAIEIVALPEPDKAATEPEQEIARISDPQQIERIVAALDTRLPLVPRALCLERYRIRFLRPDGQATTFGYSCGGNQAFLRGDQPYWQGLEVVPPEAFQNLISEYVPD